MQYGFFDDARREYVITRPDTPLPWINYLGSQAYFGIISHTAGGYSFYRDARLRRLTRYRYNNTPFDSGGRYIYIRDDGGENEREHPFGSAPSTAWPEQHGHSAQGAPLHDRSGDTGERETRPYWSPSWQPTRTPLDDYSCRHGLGYTVIGSTYRGIRAETLYFVPLDHHLEVWRLTVTNQRAEPARLSVFSAVEFCLWDAWDDATNFQRNFSTGEVEVVDGVIYHKTEYRERRNHFAYFACSANVPESMSLQGPSSGPKQSLASDEIASAHREAAHSHTPLLAMTGV